MINDYIQFFHHTICCLLCIYEQISKFSLMQKLMEYQKVNGVKSSRAFQSSTFNHHYRETISDWLEHMFSTNTFLRAHISTHPNAVIERAFIWNEESFISTHNPLNHLSRNVFDSLYHHQIMCTMRSCANNKLTSLKRGKSLSEWIQSLWSSSWKYWIHRENF